MPIDIAHHLGLMTRTVTALERNGAPAKAVIAGRRFATDADDLWDAITNPERIPRWFLPISGELRLGGRYQFEGNAGGAITTCEPPRALALTWEMGSEVSWVDVTLTPEGGGTRLELVHTAHVSAERWAKFGPGAVGVGWEGGFFGLAQYLEDPDGVIPPAERMAWMMSPEAKAMNATCARAWGEASVGVDLDAAAAAAAAERTRRFYCGEPLDEDEG